MRTRHFAAWVFSIAVGVGALAVSWPAAAAGLYRGKVIDAETKEPLVGAGVVMSWDIELRYPGHPTRFGDAEETVTDANGEFEIGQHPPRSFNPLEHVTEPNLIIFKPGYGVFPNSHVSPRPAGGLFAILRMMQHERVVIQLPRLKSQEERALANTLAYPGVPLEKVPNFMKLLERARRGLP